LVALNWYQWPSRACYLEGRWVAVEVLPKMNDERFPQIASLYDCHLQKLAVGVRWEQHKLVKEKQSFGNLIVEIVVLIDYLHCYY